MSHSLLAPSWPLESLSVPSSSPQLSHQSAKLQPCLFSLQVGGDFLLWLPLVRLASHSHLAFLARPLQEYFLRQTPPFFFVLE